MTNSCALLVVVTLAGCAREAVLPPSVPAASPPAAVTWMRAIDLGDVDILRLMPDDRVLVGAMRRDGEATQPDALWMLDRESGAVIWRGKRPRSGTHTVVGEAAGKVVLRVADATRSTFIGVALDSGVTLWERAVDGVGGATIDVTRTRVLVVTDHSLRALSAESGAQLWETQLTVRAGDTPPVLADDAAVICVAAREVACVMATTGAQLWRKPAGENERVVAARVVGSTLITGSDAGLATWDLTNGGSRWWRSIPGKHLVSLELSGNVAFVVSSDAKARTARLTAVSLSTGDARWTSEKLPLPTGGIYAIADNVYIPTPAVLFALDATTGVRAARAPLPPALVRNRRADLLLVDDATVSLVTRDGAAVFRRDSLELERSAVFADVRTWGDARALTSDGAAMLGYRPGTGVMRYAIARAEWRALPDGTEPAVVAEVRDGRVTSLRQRYTLPPCYGTDPRTQLPFEAIENAAVVGNNRSIVRELEAEGARGALSLGGVEYGDIATALGFTEVADEFLGRGQRIALGAELTLAIAHDDVAEAAALLGRGARPNGASAFNTKRSCWSVPLAGARSTAMTELLLAHGAAINLVDGAGKTALDARLAANDQANVALLRARGGKTGAELGVTR